MFRFVYTHGARMLPGFVPFAGMNDLEQVYESVSLFPLFANRLLARSRPEYEAYLIWSGFDHREAPDPLALLSVTEGRRMTDALEVFPCPQPDADGRYACRFFVHGLRHMTADALERVTQMRGDDELALWPEPDNLHDPHAVAVYTALTIDGIKLGFAPRFLARDISQLLGVLPPDQVQVRVRRVNPDAPLQQRLLCALSSPWPAGFQSCAGKEFQPIPRVLTALAA